MWFMTLFLATAIADVKTPEASQIPAQAPAPANSMQKPGGWMPSDTPGSSP